MLVSHQLVSWLSEGFVPKNASTSLRLREVTDRDLGSFLGAFSIISAKSFSIASISDVFNISRKSENVDREFDLRYDSLSPRLRHGIKSVKLGTNSTSLQIRKKGERRKTIIP